MQSNTHRVTALIAVVSCFTSLSATQTAIGLPRFSFSVGATGLSRIAIDSIADLNADGFRDILVGMPDLNRVEVRGGRTGSILATIVGTAGTSFGYEVAAIGDINADGREEIAIGAVYGGAGNRGQVQIHSFNGGGATTLLRTFAATPAATAGTLPQYGTSITRIGDLTGDGIEEIAVSAPFFSPAGAAVGYWGLVEIVNVAPAVVIKTRSIVGTVVNESFGDSVTRMFDITGDGINDLAVGASRQGFGGTIPGQAPGLVRVFSGASLGGPLGTPVVLGQAFGTFNFDCFGWSVANVNDVTGDGRDDLVVGAPDFLNGLGGGTSYIRLYSGAAFASAGGGTVAPVYTVTEPGPASQHFGWSVSGMGDLNLDGRRDLLIGAPEVFSGVGASGAAYVLSGSTGALLQTLGAATATPSLGNDVSEVMPGRLLHMAADPTSGQVHVY